MSPAGINITIATRLQREVTMRVAAVRTVKK